MLQSCSYRFLQVTVSEDEDPEGVFKRFRNSCNLAGMVYEVRTPESSPVMVYPSLGTEYYPPTAEGTVFIIVATPLQTSFLCVISRSELNAGSAKTTL